MDEESTCGKGLAEHSALPEKLSEWMDALSEVLERHMPALDRSDDASRREHDAYARLVQQQREISARLSALASEMAGYRGLPMGKHDEAAMADPKAHAAVENYVRRGTELLTLLQESVQNDRQLLEEG